MCSSICIKASRRDPYLMTHIVVQRRFPFRVIIWWKHYQLASLATFSFEYLTRCLFFSHVFLHGSSSSSAKIDPTRTCSVDRGVIDRFPTLENALFSNAQMKRSHDHRSQPEKVRALTRLLSPLPKAILINETPSYNFVNFLGNYDNELF